MSEIKFRAWNIEQKRMITGNDLCVSFQAGSFGVYDLSVSEQCLGDSIEFILEQSTGLKDKNGVEIAAGDKYKWLGWEVKAGKQIRPERTETIRNDTTEHWIEDCHKLWCISTGNSQGTVEVIGNIHEEKPCEEI